MRGKSIGILLLGLFIHIVSLKGQLSYSLFNGVDKQVNLLVNSELLVDSLSLLGPEELLDESKHKFSQNTQRLRINKGFIPGSYWVKFRLKNGTQNQSLVVTTDYGFISRFELYEVQGKTVRAVHESTQKSGNTWFAQTRNANFLVNIPTDTTRTYLLKCTGNGKLVNFNLEAQSVDYFIEEVENESLVFGVFYGVLLLILIINLFYFITLRDKLHLLYSVYIVCNIVVSLALDGYVHQLGIPYNVAEHISLFSVTLMYFSLILFVAYLFQISRKDSIAFWVVTAFLIYLIPVNVLLQVVPSSQKAFSYMHELLNANASFAYLITIGILVAKWKKDKLSSYMVLFAILMLIGGVVFFYLDQNQILSSNSIFKYCIKAGMVGELITIAFLLALKFKDTKLRNIELALELGKLKKDSVDLLNKNLQLQINPHFLYNSLAMIQRLASEEKMEVLNDSISNLAALNRSVLEASRKDHTFIEDDIELITNFIELQKLRFKNQLNYSFLVDEKITDTEVLIPPLLTQPFVENALEHGFADGGEIEVRYSLEGKHLCIYIIDDGIGILKSSQKKGHSSLATKIIKERLSNLYEGEQFRLETKDRSTIENGVTGTQVEITIPLNSRF